MKNSFEQPLAPITSDGSTKMQVSNPYNNEWIRDSGISPEITALNCILILDNAKIAKFLNWKDYKGSTGWICQGVDLETGNLTGYGQFKPEQPHKFEGGETAKYLSPKSNYDAIALTMPDEDYWHEVLTNLDISIVITEGVKKAGASLTCDLPALALSGVEMGLKNNRSTLVPTLAKLAIPGRTFILAFDMDQNTNNRVKDALFHLGKKLQDQGCLVSVATWDETYKGIDDLLVNCGSQAVKKSITEAQTYENWLKETEVNLEDDLDAFSDVRTLIEESRSAAPQLFSDILAKPLYSLSSNLGLPVEPFFVCILPILAARLKAETMLTIDPGTDYHVPPIIWAGLVGDSGTMKSPILRALIKPLSNLQKEVHEEYQKAYSQYEIDLQRWQAQSKEDRASLEKPKPLALKDLYFSDFTMESIADSIRHYPEEGYLVSIDELAAFFKSMDAYRNGKGSDRQRWLSFYGGDSLKVNRKSSAPIYIHKTSISLLGGIQPSVLEKQVLDDPTSEDGLWARFIWVRLPITSPPGISDRPQNQLSDLLKELYKSLSKENGRSYRLASEAKEVWNQWNAEIGQLIKNEPLGVLRATYPKLKELAARIALVSHITNEILARLDHSKSISALKKSPMTLPSPIAEEISANTLMNAIKFTQWLMGQTRILYCEIGLSDKSSSRTIKFVNRFRGNDWVNARTVTRWWSSSKRPNAQKAREFMSQIVALGFAEDNGHPVNNSKYKIRILETGDNGNKKAKKPNSHEIETVNSNGDTPETSGDKLQIDFDGNNSGLQVSPIVTNAEDNLKASNGEGSSGSVTDVSTFTGSENSNSTDKGEWVKFDPEQQEVATCS